VSTNVENENSTYEKVWKMIEHIAAEQLKTDKQIKELGKQIGGLGNKFGTFNDGLVMPLLVKLFKTKFKCKSVAENFKFYSNGNSMEIDLLAVSTDSCFIVEIKSHLKDEAIDQINNQIAKFRKNMKEYSDRNLYGVVVATHYDKVVLEKVSENGIYFITISDDLVNIKTLKNFKPKAW
jgi:hypothetical protein